MEKHKKIKGFEGLYEVSNYGNVRSLRNNIILKKSISTKGYYQVCLCNEGKEFVKSVHRLVAEAFIPNPDNYPQVNHKDENKLNNRVFLELDSEGNVVVNYEKSNLEWCTAKYNTNYGKANRRMAAKLRDFFLTEEAKAKISKANLNGKLSRAVVAVDDEGNVVYEFASINEAGHKLGFHQSSISACCRNCYSTHKGNFYKGLRWYYKEDWLKINGG